MIIQGQVGPPNQLTSIGPGTTPNLRLGQMADQVVSQLQGRFYENAYRGNLYSGAMIAPTVLSANTITLVAATTPLIGLWNPLTSPVNLVVLQASLQITSAPNSAGITGAFVWAYSGGNGAISTGLVPWNRKNIAQAGSYAKYLTIAQPLTGLTNNVVIFDLADFGPLAAPQPATAVAYAPAPQVQNFDGSLIVPPGGVLVLLNTTSNTTVIVATRILWTEVPL